jgi:ABC-type lipoprotein export system ATPase subunit
LNKEGTTVVMVTHSRTDAGHARRVINVLDGHVVAEGLRPEGEANVRPFNSVAA